MTRSTTLIIACLAFLPMILQAQSTCYLDGPCTLKSGLPISGGILQGNALCCQSTSSGSEIGYIRICQDCGGSYPYMVAELDCGDDCGETHIFGQLCSGDAAPLVGSNMAVCSSIPNSPCAFGGKTYCDGKVQQGYVENWSAYGEIIDTDDSEGFYPGTLSFCCN